MERGAQDLLLDVTAQSPKRSLLQFHFLGLIRRLFCLDPTTSCLIFLSNDRTYTQEVRGQDGVFEHPFARDATFRSMRYTLGVLMVSWFAGLWTMVYFVPTALANPYSDGCSSALMISIDLIQTRAIVLQQLEQESGPVAAPFSHIEVIQGVEPDHPDDDNGDDGLPTESIDGIHRQNQEESSPSPAQASKEPRPACRFWCCYHCGEAYSERTFIHLDGFLNDPCTAITLPWELSNKRVSDARIVRDLDNHYKQREHFFGPPTPPYTPFESMSLALAQRRFSHLRPVATRIDLRALYDPFETREFSSAGLIAELSDSGSGNSLSGGSRSILIGYAEETVLEPPEARSTHDRESDHDVEVDDDDYGLASLFRSATSDIWISNDQISQ
ncbi:uncharacterized protein CDV56_102330 [Aspergillus thermomutatus]|uniref:Uncharacterized protein n=1 Tax=Aspergillus thermomutatus TaxID=41047 RepID=A0A397FZS0_ASPTH|nr:uncharacterized protein CDV56_102330 [Aspergillus thermomutatus]RHZ43957.1 hypothetical protein CDV56_102330 [Aspergillus thermomutatus]